MFVLKLKDSNGTDLNIGDIVQVKNSRGTTFYSEVKYLEYEETITPFHSFAFHCIIKVDKVPDNAIKTDREERFNMWYCPDEKEVSEKDFHNYIMDWRACERRLEDKCFCIQLIK